MLDGRHKWQSRGGSLLCVFCLLSVVPFFASVVSPALSKLAFLPSALVLLSVSLETLGKDVVCRVPDGTHSANSKTLGKIAYFR